MRTSQRRPVIFLASIALLVGAILTAWAAHSTLLTREINKRLVQIPGYNGEIAKAELGVLKGTLSIHNFRLDKNEEKAPAAFVSIKNLIVDLSWWDILRGNFVFSIWIEDPNIRFLMRQRKPDQPRKFGLWQPFFSRVHSFRVSRIAISNGYLQLRNEEDIPPTNLFFDQINAEGTNLANQPTLLQHGPARVSGTVRMMNESPLTLEIEAKPFEKHAIFKLTGKLERFNLTRLNPVLRHYTGVDIENGFLTLQGTFSSEDGHFDGQVHRVCEELEILGKSDHHLTFIQAAKEFIFEVWAKDKKHKKTDDLDANFKLTGPLGYMDQDIFLATVWVAKSAFLQSLRLSFPETVTMGTPEQAEKEWLELQAKEREKLQKK